MWKFLAPHTVVEAGYTRQRSCQLHMILLQVPHARSYGSYLVVPLFSARPEANSVPCWATLHHPTISLHLLHSQPHTHTNYFLPLSIQHSSSFLSPSPPASLPLWILITTIGSLPTRSDCFYSTSLCNRLSHLTTHSFPRV